MYSYRLKIKSTREHVVLWIYVRPTEMPFCLRGQIPFLCVEQYRYVCIVILY